MKRSPLSSSPMTMPSAGSPLSYLIV